MNLNLFNRMFPYYSEDQIPMWSEWRERESEVVLKVAIPGYTKEDFKLYVEDKILFLEINRKKGSLSYSIFDQFSPETFNIEQSKATYINGMLTITIPKVHAKRYDLKVS